MPRQKPTFTILAAILAVGAVSLSQAGPKRAQAGTERRPAAAAAVVEQTGSSEGMDVLRLQLELRDRLLLALRLVGVPVVPQPRPSVIDGPDPLGSSCACEGGKEGGDGGKTGGDPTHGGDPPPENGSGEPKS